MKDVNLSGMSTGNSVNIQDLETKLNSLAGQISDPEKSSDPVSVLKRNLQIKQQMITIAQQMGQNDKAKILQDEANAIQADINKNTSIF